MCGTFYITLDKAEVLHWEIKETKRYINIRKEYATHKIKGIKLRGKTKKQNAFSRLWDGQMQFLYSQSATGSSMCI